MVADKPIYKSDYNPKADLSRQDKGSITLSKWKNRIITHIKNTSVYNFFDKNLLSFFRNLKTIHPIIYTIALAALTTLEIILTFNFVVSALKRTVFVVIPIMTMGFHCTVWYLMAEKVNDAWKNNQKNNIN